MPPRSVHVRLAYGADALEITVSDDGRGPAGPTGRTPDAVPGHGLAGIRERAAAHGGTARTGPGPDGLGFRLAVRLPFAHSRTEVGS
ncbi:hypothetical protein [Streptomyces scopuliridis]|uniref:sensor histidine kinase n=1 Tax=Streptomyces scopuliridis TaxID=452529 RepID=UPI002DDC7D6A|nr:hypothetical protein [Streptomyces scopuliridis]